MASTTATPKPKLNPYQKFILKHRIYCEKCSMMTMTLATDVIRENGHDKAVCEIHSEQDYGTNKNYTNRRN